MNRFGHPRSQEDLIGMRGGVPGIGEEFASRPPGGISHQGYWWIIQSQILRFESLHVTFCNVLLLTRNRRIPFQEFASYCRPEKRYTIRL
ncbi:hypothetical protein CDAR_413031 [Caerostris darwini]|uniref:Uncharacterized protein n=1 Tax=Caerostris darwini TaxID=1538125 RepID=A0AAV4RC68_9ARAC|nr:hypothetical protein CDAR_413031 [Caerostris darwini]